MSKVFPSVRERMTPEQRRAKDAERRLDAKQALREHRLAHEAFHNNSERLSAWRVKPWQRNKAASAGGLFHVRARDRSYVIAAGGRATAP
jgi:hypothetical protein